MRYEVPQFIEIEDKIIGPLTIWQFLYIAGGIGACTLLWVSPLPTILAIIVGVPILLLSAALAFYKINQRPFLTFLESFFMYYIGSKLYIWQKQDKLPEETEKSLEQEAEAMLGTNQPYVPRLSDSKLKDLTWALDIEERSDQEVL